MSGSVGEKTKFADPAGSVVEIVICCDVVAVNPTLLVTVSLTEYVAPRVYRWVTELPLPLVPSPKSHAYADPVGAPGVGAPGRGIGLPGTGTGVGKPGNGVPGPGVTVPLLAVNVTS